MFWTLKKLFASIELMMTNFNDTHITLLVQGGKPSLSGLL